MGLLLLQSEVRNDEFQLRALLVGDGFAPDTSNSAVRTDGAEHQGNRRRKGKADSNGRTNLCFWGSLEWVGCPYPIK